MSASGNETDKARAVAVSSPPKIQVISRAASILRALEDEPNGLSLGEISLKVGLARSTVQRLVTALADEQFLIAATPKSRVKLGPALIRLAKATKIEINQVVRPFIESLSRELEETIDLSVIQGKNAVFIDQVPGSQRLRAVSAVGERFPLHCTACGKALLATLPEAKLVKILNEGLESFTENTETDPNKVRKQIERIKIDLVAIDNEEFTEGICAVGTSFEDSFGRAYAISIPAPTNRFKRNKQEFTEALLECRNQIVAILGNNARD